MPCAAQRGGAFAAWGFGAVLILAIATIVLQEPRSGRSVLWENYNDADYFDRQVQQARDDGIRRQAAADTLGGGLMGEETNKANTNVYGYSDTQTPIYGNAARREVTEDDRHNPLLGNKGKDLLDFWDGIRATDKGTRFNNQYSSGGIGTFPGGQSTGGQREVEEDKAWNHKFVRPLTANQKIMAGEMRHKVWSVMAPNGADNEGGCKDEETSSKAADCVAEALKLRSNDGSIRPLDMQAMNMASREWRALRRPASEEIEPNDKEPSLEDVVKFNDKKIDLGPARAQMEGMQKKLDKIVNMRNFDTEHLTKESNDAWLGHTGNMCCKNYMDTVCNSPCWV